MNNEFVYFIPLLFLLFFERFQNKRNRMDVKQPVTQPWPRLQVQWSRLVAFKCVPEEHSEATCPKYTPCTGALNQGANAKLSYHIIWFFFFTFLFYVWFNFGFPHSTHVKHYFTPLWILMHPKMKLNKLGRTKEVLRHNFGSSCIAVGTNWKNSNA